MSFLVHRIDYDKCRDNNNEREDTNIISREGNLISFEDLQNKYYISKRDRYVIDKNIDLSVCMIVLKKNCIILQMDYIRCIITVDHILIFSDKSRSCSHKIIDAIKKALLEKHKGIKTSVLKMRNSPDSENNIPDQFTVLEEIFINISSMYEDRTDQLITDVSNINRRFNSDEPDKVVKNTIPFIESRVIDLKYKVCDIKDKFSEILEWDTEDMEEFCLEREMEINKEIEIEQVETLFENYKARFEDYDDKLGKMEKQLNLFMKKLNLLYLDKRNRIAIFDTNISIVTLSITIANIISSIYGMNLKNHLEDNPVAFFVTVGTIIFITVISCALLITRFKLIHEK